MVGLPLVLLVIQIFEEGSALNAGFSESRGSLNGWELDSNFAMQISPLDENSHVDLIFQCAMKCTSNIDCLTFHVEASNCQEYKSISLRKSADSLIPFRVRERAPFGANLPLQRDLWGEILVFRHDCTAGEFWPAGVTFVNKNDPTATLFAKLDEMEDFRSPDNQLHFKMCYPELSLVKCYRWSQTDNPFSVTTQDPPQGFVYKEGIFDQHPHFHGLSASSKLRNLLDADLTGPDRWWFSIGTYNGHEGRFIPGPEPHKVHTVELYIEIVWLM